MQFYVPERTEKKLTNFQRVIFSQLEIRCEGHLDDMGMFDKDIHNTNEYLSHSQAQPNIYFARPWPFTFKLNRISHLHMTHMQAKIYKDTVNHLLIMNI